MSSITNIKQYEDGHYSFDLILSDKSRKEFNKDVLQVHISQEDAKEFSEFVKFCEE